MVVQSSVAGKIIVAFRFSHTPGVWCDHDYYDFFPQLISAFNLGFISPISIEVGLQARNFEHRIEASFWVNISGKFSGVFDIRLTM